MVSTTEIAENVRAFMRDGVELVRKEVQLAKLETNEKISQLTSGLVFVIVGARLMVVALGFLAEALVEGLAALIGSEGLAALLVGAIVAIVGIILILKGKSNLSPENLKPSRTLRTTERGYDKLSEAV